jgi:hypothetical protein
MKRRTFLRMVGSAIGFLLFHANKKALAVTASETTYADMGWWLQPGYVNAPSCGWVSTHCTDANMRYIWTDKPTFTGGSSSVGSLFDALTGYVELSFGIAAIDVESGIRYKTYRTMRDAMTALDRAGGLEFAAGVKRRIKESEEASRQHGSREIQRSSR